MQIILTILYGIIVGFSFGLTGGGGSIFAVPLLVYGIGIWPHGAICISMIVIGILAWIGTLRKIRRREIDVMTGLSMAGLGILGAPFGAWLNRFLSGKTLMLLFVSMILVVGLRMFFQNSKVSSVGNRENRQGLNSRISDKTLLGLAGIFIGILAGLLGMGGGFILVSALVLLGKMEVHRAISTSMFITALTSISAVSSHFLFGQRVPFDTTLLFTAGGISGFWIGSSLGKYIPTSPLQKIVAVAMVLTAIFIVIRTFS